MRTNFEKCAAKPTTISPWLPTPLPLIIPFVFTTHAMGFYIFGWSWHYDSTLYW